eukprot:2833259-Pyramimonas_sp.AAC.1
MDLCSSSAIRCCATRLAIRLGLATPDVLATAEFRELASPALQVPPHRPRECPLHSRRGAKRHPLSCRPSARD